ncbi:MAG TPA: cadherin-like beta sandwich domain-containing protein [Methylomirabilota bacterium]|nr:cadherin-like beta sandwich domain-containing protein [Methylomirabilota bacterium]
MLHQKWYQQNIAIILFLVFFFPLGLYLMFKYSDWTSKTKKIVTVAVVALLALGVFGYLNAPPTASTNLKSASNAPVEASSYKLEGKIFPYDSTLTVNGETVKTGDQGKYSYAVPLNEGDNTITVTVKDGDKVTKETYKLHRYTKKEKAKRKAEAEKKKQQAVAANAKSAKAKADLKAKADAKKAQDAAKKAKAAADKKLAADKKAAEAKAKTDAEAARKAQEEAARNAPKTSFGDGTYLVNKEIVPGTYRAANSGGYCYYARLSGTGGTIGDIIANGNPSGQAVVTIASTDVAFESTRCGTWTKI